MSDEERRQQFQFSREIRLGDIITVLGVGIATIAAWQKVDLRVDQLEKAQTAQVTTNREIRQDIRDVSQGISAELKDQGVSIRRIEDKVNRARL